MAKHRITLMIIALIFSAPMVKAHALQCDGGIIDIGDSTQEIKRKCGDPVWKNQHNDQIIQRIDFDSERLLTIFQEEWLYNFGPDRFMQLLSFKNNQLVDIEIRNYGYAAQKIDKECNGRVPELGDTPGEVVLKCGEPGTKDQQREELVTPTSHYNQIRSAVMYDQWVYNTDPGHFKYILQFKNARLVDVKTGDYSR